MKKTKENKAVTLVALVVTIVVLLILAGVSISLVLGNDGIIGKSKTAREKYAESGENDLISMNEAIDEIGEQTDDSTTKTPSKTFEEAKVELATDKTEVILQNGSVTIPKGFKISEDSADSLEDGIVIEDGDENQFVWVPVTDISKYRRTAYANQDISTYSEELPADEEASIKANSGFYIGRYEAGDEDITKNGKTYRSKSTGVENKVVIRKRYAPYDYVTRTQAKKLAEGFGAQQGYDETIKTKLVSSYAWDTTIAFQQTKISNYGSSSRQGNYSGISCTYTDFYNVSTTKTSSSAILIPTGQTTSVCNIFDMGGNVAEWTTEMDSETNYTYRGGTYIKKYDGEPAGYRKNNTDRAFVDVGFRIALFM